MDRPDSAAASPATTEERLALIAHLCDAFEPEATCLDDTFRPSAVPDSLRALGVTDPQRRLEIGSLQKQMSSRDHDALMATVARARRLGYADCTVTSFDADVMTRTIMVDLSESHGVYLALNGPDLPPIPGHESTERTRPRRIVHHRNQLAELVWVDPRTRDLLGIDPDEMLGRSSLEFIHPDDHDRGIDGWLSLLAGQPVERHRIRWATGDGDWCWLEVSHVDRRETDGFIETELLDVDDEMRALARAREGEVRFRALTESLPLGVVLVDGTGEIEYVNQWLRTFTGSESETPVGTELMARVGDGAEDIDKAFYDALVYLQGTDLDITFQGRRRNDDRVCRVRIRPVTTDVEIPFEERKAIASIEDITDSLELERQLRARADTDDLTGLWNRAALVDRLQRHLDQPDGPTEVAALFIDLDGFKMINDGLGHDAGDGLLVSVSDRLRSALRESDIIARVGGDEFVVLMQDCPDLQHATSLAERLIADCEAPIDVDGTSARISCSIGIAMLQGVKQRTAEDLLASADLAMYKAKRAGGGQWASFDEGLRSQMLQTFELQRGILDSIQNEEFSLFLQPLRDLQTGQTVGAECLVRWIHPERGLTGTEQFIPIAEQSGLIVPLGRWVTDRACRIAARASAIGRDDLRISVNVSGRQLAHGGFVDDFLSAVDRYGVSPSQMIIEVTETVFIGTDGDAVDMLRTLKRAGCTIALDDFGTGYSSLNQLRLMPASMIKIDGSYVGDLEHDPGTRAITDAMVDLSRTLDFEIIAEGVETPEQLRLLQLMDVRLGQGYLLGRPVPEEEFFTSIRQRQLARFPDFRDVTTAELDLGD